MRVKDVRKWEKELNFDRDPYTDAILKYATEWADAMERRLSKGEKLIDIAERCEPKGHGVTGFMFGAAVLALAAHWVYGEELRRWHNAEYGQPDAKGTVNPALMTIEVPK